MIGQKSRDCVYFVYGWTLSAEKGAVWHVEGTQ